MYILGFFYLVFSTFSSPYFSVNTQHLCAFYSCGKDRNFFSSASDTIIHKSVEEYVALASLRQTLKQKLSSDGGRQGQIDYVLRSQDLCYFFVFTGKIFKPQKQEQCQHLPQIIELYGKWRQSCISVCKHCCFKHWFPGLCTEWPSLSRS